MTRPLDAIFADIRAWYASPPVRIDIHSPYKRNRRLAQQEARALRLLHRYGGRTVAPLNLRVPAVEITPLVVERPRSSAA
jgi:hypothetical protein